jgi:hypothetical protein
MLHGSSIVVSRTRMSLCSIRATRSCAASRGSATRPALRCTGLQISRLSAVEPPGCGHTPGHQSLLVKLPQMGAVVIVGDAAHFRENYDSDGVPAFNFDRAQTVASLERLKKIAANLKATVIIQHDARDIDKLPAFPASAK